MSSIDNHKLVVNGKLFCDSLLKALAESPRGYIFRCAVACVSPDAVDLLSKHLRSFIKKGGTLEIVAGIDIGSKAIKGLARLVDKCGYGSIFVFWNPTGGVFHPKLYCISDSGMKTGHFWVGSWNLSIGGLRDNYECGIGGILVGNELSNQIRAYFEAILEHHCCKPLTPDLLRELQTIDEKQKRPEERASPSTYSRKLRRLFTLKGKTTPFRPGFVMLLSRNDISGKRFEPYFLVPVSARDADPDFWGWPDLFRRKRSSDVLERRIRVSVHVNKSTCSEERRIYWFPERSEFRFVSPTVYSLGPSYAGSILYILNKKDEFEIQVFTPKESAYGELLKHATNLVSGQKRWGYIK